MPKVSAIVTCFNEEINIERCLESLAFCDEIVVVDSFSEDSTFELAQKYTDRVFQREYFGSANQKNFAIDQVRHDWVLILDADEWLSDELKEEISALLRRDEESLLDGYTLHRVNFIFGKKVRYSGWQRDRVLRLFRKERGGYPERRVHADASVEGRTRKLKQPLYHNTYVSVSQYFVKFHNYTRWAAAQMWKDGRKFRVSDLAVRPLFAFIKNYILNMGFMDGLTGLILCTLQSFYVATKYIILWEYHFRYKRGLPLDLPVFDESVDSESGS